MTTPKAVFVRGVKLIQGIPASEIPNFLIDMDFPSYYYTEAKYTILQHYPKPDTLVYGTLYIFALNGRITFTQLNERNEYGSEDKVEMPEYTAHFIFVDTYPELIAKGNLLGAKV